MVCNPIEEQVLAAYYEEEKVRQEKEKQKRLLNGRKCWVQLLQCLATRRQLQQEYGTKPSAGKF